MIQGKIAMNASSVQGALRLNITLLYPGPPMAARGFLRNAELRLVVYAILQTKTTSTMKNSWIHFAYYATNQVGKKEHRLVLMFRPWTVG